MDVLVIGAGLSGAVIANKLANNGKKVLIIEKRQNVAGNIYDVELKGVLVHKYGPHIFHTSNEEVNSFISNFWELNDFKNRVGSVVENKIIPLPFNFKGLDEFFPNNANEIKNKLEDQYGINKRIPILDLLKTNDKDLKEVSTFIYKNIFENYTTKMWGLNPKEIDESVTARVPIVSSYDDRYFSDKYEGLPKQGYTKAIEKMLDHPNITIRKNINAVDILNFDNENHIIKLFNKIIPISTPIIYTGAIDELFKYKYGILDYRSLDIKFFEAKIEKFQKYAVVNYPADPKMTRITEYKNMTLQNNVENTIISKEYPGTFNLKDPKYSIPYYPLQTQMAKEKYNKYYKHSTKFQNLFLLGRLAQFKYINMDQAIKEALDLSDKVAKYGKK